MFRELSQKKNIITLTLIVWLLFEYFSLPVCALYGGRTTDEQINTEVISNSLDNIVDSEFDNGVAAIEVDNTENIQLEQTEISNTDITVIKEKSMQVKQFIRKVEHAKILMVICRHQFKDWISLHK